MSEAETSGVVKEPLQRSIIARPIAAGAVHTIIGPAPAPQGPWSVITDTPHPTRDMVGPPAAYLAVAAWARLNGGHRGGRRPPWPDPPAGRPSRLPGRGGYPPRRARVWCQENGDPEGPLSETEQLRLRRAAEYCPVGQLFTKGALTIEDQVTGSVESAAAEAARPAAQGVQPPLDALPTCPPGAVHGRYLVDTPGIRRQRCIAT